MGLILGAIWTAASKVYFNQKVTKAVTQTLAIAESMKGAFPNGTIITNGTPWLTQFAVNSGMFPADMIQPLPCTGTYFGGASSSFSGTAGCAVGPFQDQFAIGSQTGYQNIPTGNPRTFDIVIGSSTMTATQCAAYLAAFVPAAINDGLINVSFNGTNTPVNSTTTTPTQFSNCAGASTNPIVFQFQL